jgi:hypothetical protein
MVLALRHTPDFSAPPTIAQIERQIRWEAAAVEAGVRLYHEQLNKPGTTIAETSPRQRIIREIMQEFVPWLADAQELLRMEVVNARGRMRDWTLLMLLLPAEKLAYLAGLTIRFAARGVR